MQDSKRIQYLKDEMVYYKKNTNTAFILTTIIFLLIVWPMMSFLYHGGTMMDLFHVVIMLVVGFFLFTWGIVVLTHYNRSKRELEAIMDNKL